MQDPRDLMEHDKKMHLINKKRATQGLPAIQDLESVDLQRFSSCIMFHLKLTDLAEAEQRVEKLCKTV